jgi:hypothetical protein
MHMGGRLGLVSLLPGSAVEDLFNLMRRWPNSFNSPEAAQNNARNI